MDLRGKEKPKEMSPRPLLAKRSLAVLGTVLLCTVMYSVLFWLMWHANFIGALIVATASASLGALASVLLSHICNRVLGAGNWQGTLRVSLWLTMIAVASISFFAMQRVPTASWFTGIGGLGLLGPVLFVPLAWYFWTIGKKIFFLV